ncbi:MAG: hypothetical protein GY835_06245 [bacterium]|nr:hypothetical protein [bacterium]
MPIHLDIQSDLAVIELRQPPRNMLSTEMLKALLAALDQLESGDPPTLLLRSSGRHFSTGYPIDEIPEAIFHADPEVRANAPFEQVMARLTAYPAPIVAAIQGDAYGGAVELLSCVDLRIGVQGIRFAVPAVRLGLIYSHTGLRRMIRGFGSNLSREMLLTGEPVSARRARRAGFLCRLVRTEELQVTAEVLLESIGRGAPLAIRGTRRVLNLVEEAEPIAADLLNEIALLRHTSWLSEDFKEAQQAFIAKRRPVFKGC